MRTAISPVGSRSKRQSGFTYIMVLAAVVIIAILAEVATLLSSRIMRADREAELLFRGQAYRNAIKSYYESGKGVKTFPNNLEELLKDSRFAHKRHIRALYPNPMNDGEWTLVHSGSGGISGVVSSGSEEPLKQANFPLGLEKFEGAASYGEWIFEYVPKKKKPGGPVNNKL